MSASMTPDLLGDYVIELTVTDDQGASDTAQTTVSTYNTAPVAIAGADQVVLQLGTPVELNGAESYDDDGDSLTYSWSFASLPPDSQAELLTNSSDPARALFVPDVYGDYVVKLVVTDVFGASSDPGDQVLISFENVAPIAEAGSNQSVIVGDNVYLDGSASSDANGDLLTYQWSFMSKPDNSTTFFDDETSPNPLFYADQAGQYVVSLIVNDGLLDSDPSNLTVVAITQSDALTQALQSALQEINYLDRVDFKFKIARKFLTAKINFVLRKLDKGQYRPAYSVLKWTVARRMDGCALWGRPDTHWGVDTIVTCTAQDQVYPFVADSLNLLEQLLDSQ
jgi:hypothetical protein